MSYFSPNTGMEEKRKLLFKLIDNDKDGFLSQQDLFYFYSNYIFSLNQPGEPQSEEFSCIYSQETLTSIVNKIIEDFDIDKDKKLSYMEYGNAITDFDVREFIDIYLI